MNPLQLHTTRTRAKQTFVPADRSGQVALFVRGPTVYDLPHPDHAKTHTQFHLLVGLLRTRGFTVTHAQNITDGTTRSSAGRASWRPTRPSSRACSSARIWTTRARRATTP
jgi:hypothetical protein